MPFPHIQGALQEKIVAMADQCVKASGLSAAEAAMAEPLSVCLHATRRAGDLIGNRLVCKSIITGFKEGFDCQSIQLCELFMIHY